MRSRFIWSIGALALVLAVRTIRTINGVFARAVDGMPLMRPRPPASTAEETGLRFVHFNGMSGEFYFPEIMPPGAGLLDYDSDGDLDVYLVQGKMLGDAKTLKATPARRMPPSAIEE